MSSNMIQQHLNDSRLKSIRSRSMMYPGSTSVLMVVLMVFFIAVSSLHSASATVPRSTTEQPQATHHISKDETDYDRHYNSEHVFSTNSTSGSEEILTELDLDRETIIQHTANITNDVTSSLNKSAHLVIKSENDTIDGHGVHSHWGQDSSASGTQVAVYNTTTRRLSINTDGLYYIYAQVTYSIGNLNESYVGYSISHWTDGDHGKRLITCKARAATIQEKSNDGDGSAIVVETPCYTARTLYLRRGDALQLMQHYIRKVETGSDKTFWGVACVDCLEKL